MDDSPNSAPPRIAVDLAWPLRVVTGLLFAAIVALAVAQVGFRYGLGRPLIWSEELAKLLLVWMVFLGAAVLCWDGKHLDVDVLFRVLPSPVRRVIRWVNLILASFFLIALSVWSWELVQLEGYADLSSLGISRAWVRLPATVGGGLMIAFMLLRRISGGWRREPDDGTRAL